ncbi:MAG: peptide chain release factor 2 [bacterium]
MSLDAEILQRVNSLRERSSALGRYLDLPALKARFAELDEQSQDSSLWDDRERAGTILRERSGVESKIKSFEDLEAQVTDLDVYVEMAGEGDDDALSELLGQLEPLEVQIDEMEMRRMLSGEYDINNAIISIHPGAGGTESQDWGDMLLRMYLRWAERRGFTATIMEYTPGEGAGLKTATISIEGEYAYGYMSAEGGVHRLVRISPFDNNARRHTSFASIHVFPELDDDIEIDIRDEDLRVDTYRASGAGGQHINKTDSAVRLTHLPTNIVVQCQNERSQHKNRATAMKILRARLYEHEKALQAERLSDVGTVKKDVAFGNQIRSYVLAPYQMVKDTRTGVEVGNTAAVLDGDIDGFIHAFLMEQSSP